MLTKHPELLTTKTVVIRDTLYTEHVRKDTTFVFDVRKDTSWIIAKERLRIQYLQRKDTIRITGECLPDTILKIDSVLVKNPDCEKLVDYEKGTANWIKFLGIAVILLTLILILKR